MPQQSPAPDVSFQLPVYSDSQQNIEYKTIHVVVVKPTTAINQDNTGLLLFPLVMVFIIAVTILIIVSKIKQGPTTNSILNLLERLSSGVDKKIKSGRQIL